MPFALAALTQLLSTWSIIPGTQPLLALPIAIAAWLISTPVAAASAAAQTVLLSLPLFNGPSTGNTAGVTVSTLTLMWATVCASFLARRELRRFARWSWEYYQLGKSLQEQARSQQVEYKQALADASQANLQLGLMNQKLADARLAAEAAEKAKAAFVANVSHEFRTPLNMIIGFSEMITQAPEAYGDSIPAALMADLFTILRNSQHLSALVDDVLDLSQIEAGRMALTRERVALLETVESARVVVEPLLTSKGLHLQIDVPPDLPLIFCDRTRIREVVLNLLSNAARFTEKGGVCVKAWREGADIVVQVADTGPGITPEQVSRIFRPFEQADSSIRRRYGGTGLGLAICRSFVELHGGAMWIESKPGAGTAVFFRLPIDPPEPRGNATLRWLNPDWEWHERTRPSLAPTVQIRPRLLVLEAKDSLRRLLKRYLDNVDIVPVTSLPEALAELARLPAQALLINDTSVAGTLQRFSSNPALPPSTPVIICSIPDPTDSIGVPGIVDYLVKPISRERLLTTLDRLDLRGKTVLVVDDEPEALRLFWRMLASAERGYRVLRAGTAEEALQLLRRDKVDAMLLDLIMPGMGGFRLLEMRAQEPALRDIPIVVISARDPAGQPIVSNGLAVMQQGGLAIHQLMASFEALTQILKPGSPSDGPAPIASQHG